MRNRSLRRFSVSAALVGSSLAGGVLLAAPASASQSSYNRANVELRGGNARALSLCVNVARVYARANRPIPAVQSNLCGAATAVAGAVVLDNVGIVVDQQGGGHNSVNSAAVVLSGGDAEAVAACVNYVQGTATAIQRNQCAGARAQGGNVTVKNSDITIIQAA
jgi:hypothetical protein